ncbi:hypothetical protein Cni_G06629 [Canna indica]|uniref:Ninja-family protein n=1 Tax=Canna indica TaxID=4628 RepID=A0AAQ3JXD0_9LILI|nr:hypothetical protein Cni_G06629 [Canna indica]
MEDENGIELSLGLSYGGSSGKTKSRYSNLDHKIDEGSSSKVVGANVATSDVSLKNFFQTNTEKQDHYGKQSVSQPRENFWTDLRKVPLPVPDGSANIQSNQLQFMRYQEPFIASSKSTDVEEEKSGSKKRQLPSEEINFQKKHAPSVQHSEAAGKGPADTFVKVPHISASVDDGCSGENEDVAESEAEGSNSWLVSQREDSSKQSDLPKLSEKSASSGLTNQGQKQKIYVGKESNPEFGKMSFGIPLPHQPMTVMNAPYSLPVEVPPAVNMPNTSAFPAPCVMQLMPIANNELPMVQAVNGNNLQLAFGYSTVQLPRLETNSSWAFVSQSQHASSSVTKIHADGVPDSGCAETHVSGLIPHGSASTLAFEGKSSSTKGSGKHAMENGPSSSSQAEDEGKGINTLFRQRDIANAGEGSTFEGSHIRPGVAPNVKFGGCGSYPDLPWVSTTEPGPNGRTISGVTYKYSESQIKIVCACHGFHMSPEEFVMHASADAADPENNTFASFATTNPAASAQN